MTEIIFKFLLTKKSSRVGKFEYYIIIHMKILDWHHVCQSHDPTSDTQITFEKKDLKPSFFIWHHFPSFLLHLSYHQGHRPGLSPCVIAPRLSSLGHRPGSSPRGHCSNHHLPFLDLVKPIFWIQ